MKFTAPWDETATRCSAVWVASRRNFLILNCNLDVSALIIGHYACTFIIPTNFSHLVNISAGARARGIQADLSQHSMPEVDNCNYVVRAIVSVVLRDDIITIFSHFEWSV